MKWYNQRAYKQHIKDLKHLDVADWRKKLCLEFVNSIANTFDRSYPRIGILDINDLIQEGYISALKGWNKLNWDKIESLPGDEQQAMIWSYIRLRIDSGIRRAIARDRETIRIPEHYYNLEHANGSNNAKSFDTDVFLSKTFASFFNQNYADTIEYQEGSYENERLNEFLHDVMDEFLTHVTKQVVMMFYGMDESNDIRRPIKDIAKWLAKPPSAVNKIKQRGIKKLQDEEAINKINKYLQNAV